MRACLRDASPVESQRTTGREQSRVARRSRSCSSTSRVKPAIAARECHRGRLHIEVLTRSKHDSQSVLKLESAPVRRCGPRPSPRQLLGLVESGYFERRPHERRTNHCQVAHTCNRRTRRAADGARATAVLDRLDALLIELAEFPVPQSEPSLNRISHNSRAAD